MKLLLTADWQARFDNLDLCEKVVKQLLCLRKAHKVEILVHLGDVKHHLNPVDQRVTNFLLDAFKRLVGEFECVYVLLGNHDRISVSDEADSCFPVLRSVGVEVADAMRIVRERDAVLHLVPYYRDPAVQKQVLLNSAKQATREQSILFFHADVTGAKWNVATKVEEGISIQDLQADRYQACFGGHIHYPQRLGPNPIWYVGSPFSQDWSEANQEKSHWIYDTGSRKAADIPTHLPGHFEWVVPGEKPVPEEIPDGSKLRVYIEDFQRIPQLRQELAQQFPTCSLQVLCDLPKSKRVLDSIITKGSGDQDLIQAYLRANPITEYSPEATTAYLLSRLEKIGVVQRSTGGIEFLEATGKNFLNFPQVDAHYQHPGVTVIRGTNRDWPDRQNGVGKTNYLQLPSVALFGRTIKGQAFDGWMSDFVEKGGPVWVRADFRLPSGKVCQILRQRSPKPLVEIRIEGKLIDAGKDAEKTIRLLTGLTWEVLTNALYLDQARVSRVLSGTDKERKEILAQFLNTERFAQARNLIIQEYKRYERELVEGGGDLREAQARIETLDGMLHLMRPEERRRQLRQAQSKLQELDRDAEEYRKRENLWRISKREIEDRELKRRTWENELTEQESLARARVERDEKELKHLSNLETCPVCRQKVSKKVLAAHLAELKDAIRINQAQYDQARAEWRKCEAFAAELDRDKQAYEKKTRELERWSIRLRDERAKYRNEQSNAEKDLKMIEAYQEQKAEQQRRAKLVTAAMDCYQAEIRFLGQCEQAFSRNGIPAFLAGQLLPRLNQAAEFYSELFSGGEIQVRFSLSGSDLDVAVENRHGGREVIDQSQGETRMASLVCSFALREVMVPCNVLVLDEPGEGLDAVNAAAFAEGLKTVADRFGTVLLTTHNPAILSSLDDSRKILIEKRDGKARVV